MSRISEVVPDYQETLADIQSAARPECSPCWRAEVVAEYLTPLVVEQRLDLEDAKKIEAEEFPACQCSTDKEFSLKTVKKKILAL